MEEVKKIEKNISNNEIEDSEEKTIMARTYYRTYREALQHSRAGDVILYDPLARMYYITRPGQKKRFRWF